MTAARVLARARELAPECELMARFESGLTWAAGEVLAGRLDVSFGRAAGLDPAVLRPSSPYSRCGTSRWPSSCRTVIPWPGARRSP